jgi:hypothetical protein
MKSSRGFAAAACTAVFAVVVACSNSGTNGGGGTGGGATPPTCQGATGSTGAGSSACNSCLESSCSPDLSSEQTNCGAYVTCYEGCQCSDTACLTGCLAKIDSTCQSADGILTACLLQYCSSECASTTGATDAGGAG